MCNVNKIASEKTKIIANFDFIYCVLQISSMIEDNDGSDFHNSINFDAAEI
jgi:hypothetical protein